MAKIIALKGASDKGKSKTLNIVYQHLLLFGFAQIPNHFKILGNPAQYDFFDVIERKGFKVGIATMGDYQNGAVKKSKNSVETFVDDLIAQGCDVVVCAVNLGLTRAISHIASYNHDFVHKRKASSDAEERVINGEDAEKILKKI